MTNLQWTSNQPLCLDQESDRLNNVWTPIELHVSTPSSSMLTMQLRVATSIPACVYTSKNFLAFRTPVHPVYSTLRTPVYLFILVTRCTSCLCYHQFWFPLAHWCSKSKAKGLSSTDINWKISQHQLKLTCIIWYNVFDVGFMMLILKHFRSGYLFKVCLLWE